MVGTSGKPPGCLIVETARAFRRPDLMCGSVAATVSIVYVIWPLMMSVIAGAVPLYGTWRALMPAWWLKSSAKRCAVAPVPDEEKVYLSGFFFSSSMNSRALFAGNDGLVTITYALRQIRLIGARSLSGSYGIF